MAALARLTKKMVLLSVLFGCSTQPVLWTVDSISAGDRSFDSSRLRYIPQKSHPPIAFEMMKIGGQVDAYLSLNRFRFKTAERIKVIFSYADQSFEEEIAVHEGRMRLHLPSAATERLIKALQDGHKIVILLDDFEEVLEPDQFSDIYAKFLTEGGFFQKIFKGPVP